MDVAGRSRDHMVRKINSMTVYQMPEKHWSLTGVTTSGCNYVVLLMARSSLLLFTFGSSIEVVKSCFFF